MSISLKDVVNSSTTAVQRINTASKGGTYIQIKCHRVQIPSSCKKEWGCVWFKIQDAFIATDDFYYEPFSDQLCEDVEVSQDYRTIQMIFREDPYIFLHDFLGCAYEETLRFDHRISDSVYSVSRISFNQFEFEEISNDIYGHLIEKKFEISLLGHLQIM